MLDFFPVELESQVNKTFYNSELGGEGWTLYQLSIAIDATPGMTWVIRNAIENKENELINQGFYLLEIDTLETTRRQVLGLPIWATHEAKVYFTQPPGIGIAPLVAVVLAVVLAIATGIVVWRLTQAQMVSQIEATNRSDITAKLTRDVIAEKIAHPELANEIDEVFNKSIETIKESNKIPQSSGLGDVSNILKWLAIGAGIYLIITALPSLKALAPQKANPIRRRLLLR